MSLLCRVYGVLEVFRRGYFFKWSPLETGVTVFLLMDSGSNPLSYQSVLCGAQLYTETGLHTKTLFLLLYVFIFYERLALSLQGLQKLGV